VPQLKSEYHDGERRVNGIVEKFEDGPIWTVGYLLYDTDSLDAAAIDVPMWSADRMYARISEIGLKVKYIIATHGHWDHIGDMHKLAAITGAKVCGSLADEWMMRDPNGMMIPPPTPLEAVGLDIPLENGMVVQVGKIGLNVIATPGHSAGSISLYIKDWKLLFTGDTLFAGSVGRTDLASGSGEMLSKSILERILSLPEDVAILPGHGPESTLKREKLTNPFVQMIYAGG